MCTLLGQVFVKGKALQGHGLRRYKPRFLAQKATPGGPRALPKDPKQGDLRALDRLSTDGNAGAIKRRNLLNRDYRRVDAHLMLT